MPDAKERLGRLEQLGEVPSDGDIWDWWLAQRTSWWGKRLDPETFWKGRVLWLDRSATRAAQRHGRFYPPTPYETPAFASRSDADQPTLPSADSPDIRYYFSDRESVFWDKFAKTTPKPPDDIHSLQILEANQVLASPDGIDEIDRQDLILGCPREALVTDAIRWEYVFKHRAEYERLYTRTHRENTLYSSNYLNRLRVDRKLITNPLTDEQIKAANAWKIAYLQRLRKEKADETYINAYLQAWNLQAADVFGGTNGP